MLYCVDGNPIDVLFSLLEGCRGSRTVEADRGTENEN